MSLEKKLEYKQRIQEIDALIVHVKSIPQDVRARAWLDNLMGYKYEVVGFLHDLVMDERDNFITAELMAADAKQRGEQPNE